MADLVGNPAPDFTLEDQSGETHVLNDYRGKKVLLYFYPKDDTPGCTIEAKCFRDQLNELAEENVVVFGVSADDVASHKKFAEKFDLNFPLLADVGGDTCQLYDVWKEKKMFGKTFMGVARQSFLIDEEGIVQKHYKKVKPADHVDEILADLRSA
jgi:peroxiredoxin Q/BCP